MTTELIKETLFIFIVFVSLIAYIIIPSSIITKIINKTDKYNTVTEVYTVGLIWMFINAVGFYLYL